MTKVIGIFGFKGSGKDTAGSYLVREHGFFHDSFATPLKDSLCAIFGWDRDMIEGSTKESREWRERPDVYWEEKLNWDTDYYKSRFTPRFAMQYLGTEILRKNFHPDLWLLSLERRLFGKEKVVITDVRYKNEMKVITMNKGISIRIKRGSEPEWYDYGVKASMGDPYSIEKMNELGIHSSEWAWLSLPMDYVIENDGTISDLEDKMRWILEKNC